MRNKKLRLNFFIDSKVQLRASFTFILISLMTTILVGVISYFFIYKNNLIYVESGLALDPKVFEFLAKENTMFVRSILLTFVVLAVILFIIGIYLSHKVAGPLYAFQREMKKVINGEDNVTLNLRPRDELKFLETSFNNFTKEINEENKKQNEIFNSIKQKLNNVLKLSIKDDDKNKIEDIIGSL